jgi:hypothetical protein
MKEQIQIRFANTRFESIVKIGIIPAASATGQPTAHTFVCGHPEKPFAKNRIMKAKSLFASFVIASLCIAKTLAVPLLGSAFTYQGRLNDGGQPASGNYDLIFSLMDAETNGNSVAPAMATPNTVVQDGYFTVKLDFGPNAFDGSARWLDIVVRTNCNCLAGYTTLAPRQPLTPAPHALFAVNAAQATTAETANSANSASSADTANLATTANTANSVAWANITGVPAGFADGVDNDTTYMAGAGLSLSGLSNQFSVNFLGSGNANTAARSDHDHFGGNWSGNSSGFGLTVINSSTTGTGLYAQQGSGSGVPPFFGFKAAIWAEASNGDAVYGASGSAYGSGVSGYATHTTQPNFGVYGETDSQLGRGVFGIANSLSGTNNCGVFGQSNSTNGGCGVVGRLTYGSTNTSKVLYPAGVLGEAHNGYGVVGFSDGYAGVSGHSVASTGVSGLSSDGAGVDGNSLSGAGISGTSFLGNPIEAYGWTGLFQVSRVFYVTTIGNVHANGTFYPNGADFAEMLPSQNDVEPGDVLVIGEDGKLARSTQPNQENVAGVHATKPGIVGGAHDGADLNGKIPMAVVGVVPVKVTSENGPIKPGDKLTTSSTPGHAMKADRHAGIGTVIGKALQPLNSERGVIEMLVVLQ